MSDLQQELTKEFIIESFEFLDKLDEDLLSLEKGDCTSELINRVFRAVHTIKGTSGCLGYQKLQSVTHVGENLLSLLREGKLTAHSEMVSTLLSLSDALRKMLQNVENLGSEGTEDYSSLIKKLEELQKAPTPEAGFGFFDDEPTPSPSHQAPVPPLSPAPENLPVSTPPIIASPISPISPRPPAPLTAQESGDAVKSSMSDSAIRVDVAHLDRLMNLVGELVLARNQILQHANHFQDGSLLATCQRLNLITTELQEGVMKTRMQPIGNIWAKFPRVVRDLAHDLGKQVRLEMIGNETELDKTIIEAIKDPLTHIIRNSVDHGIEMPANRVPAGKAEEGHLLLKAFHEGGQVNIEIIDDGGGIYPEKVKAKALQNGIITPEAAAKMSDREATNLIFKPGFSTAEKITNVSGRGVGMDVVKTNIEKIGGSVDVQSIPGKGTTLKIKIPLTLAIIPALLITSGGDRFAIPQVSLLELVSLEGEKAFKGIEKIQGVPVYRLRGNLLPLVYLNRELKITDSFSKRDWVNIVVLQADGRPFGLVVDQINDTEEIVVKPLAKQLKKIHQFSGSTIMGDGRVALILDVMGIAQNAHVIAKMHDHISHTKTEESHQKSEDQERLLVFRVGKQGRMAVPLSAVHRLEEFSVSMIERVGDHDVILYREKIILMIYLAELLKYKKDDEADSREKMQVVVYTQNDKMFGLVVDQILDIVEDHVKVQERDSRPGVLGPAVIQGRVTEMLDVPGLVRLCSPTIAMGEDLFVVKGSGA